MTSQKAWTLLILSSILLYAGNTMLGFWPGHDYKLLLNFGVYGIATYLFAQHTSFKRISTLVLVLPFILIDAPFHIFDYANTQTSLLSSISPFPGVFLGWLCASNASKPIKAFITLCFSVFIVYAFFWGYALWLHYLNFGTFSGHVTETFPTSLQIHTLDKKGMASNAFEQQTQVLDFWTIGCGICFEEFPVFEKLSKQHPEVQCYAVNIPYREQTRLQKN
jgi:hypothetical protein